jgi:hypothetical protein
MASYYLDTGAAVGALAPLAARLGWCTCSEKDNNQTEHETKSEEVEAETNALVESGIVEAEAKDEQTAEETKSEEGENSTPVLVESNIVEVEEKEPGEE